MDDQVLWGLVLIVYLVPFWIWQVSEWPTIETLKKLYPGRPNAANAERRFDIVGAVWCVGFVGLLAAWKSGDGHPIAYGILIGSVVFAALACRAANKRWNVLGRQLFRYWLAASAVWALAVAGWFIVFSRESRLENDQFLLLAVFPPLVAAFSLVAWQWARTRP
jgi:hypothetical protein